MPGLACFFSGCNTSIKGQCIGYDVIKELVSTTNWLKPHVNLVMIMEAIVIRATIHIQFMILVKIIWSVALVAPNHKLTPRGKCTRLT